MCVHTAAYAKFSRQSIPMKLDERLCFIKRMRCAVDAGRMTHDEYSKLLCEKILVIKT